MIKKALILILLIGGVIGWYLFIWTPSHNEKQLKTVTQEEDQASKTSDQSETIPPPVTKTDVIEAEKVAKKYIEVYFSSPRQSPIDLAQQLEAYASTALLKEMQLSMKVPPPAQVSTIELSRVEPAFLPGGITFHSIVTMEDQEIDYWFSMMKLDGQWLVVKEEEDMGGSD